MATVIITVCATLLIEIWGWILYNIISRAYRRKHDYRIYYYKAGRLVDKYGNELE